MREHKINEVVELIVELNRVLDWCNKHIDEARNNMDKFFKRYCDPLDKAYARLYSEEKRIIDKYLHY